MATVHVLALPVPNNKAYDPAFAYEIAVIIPRWNSPHVIKKARNIFYYITVMNEPYAMPSMPGDVKEGILRGNVPLPALQRTQRRSCARNCLGAARFSTKTLRESQEILETKNMAWPPMCGSVTSYKELYF